MNIKITSVCKIILTAVLARWICMPSVVAQTKPLDVCEVLQNLGRYRGKLITVRGEFVGNALDGLMCPVALKTGDYEWHKSILIEIPHEKYGPIEDPPANWRIDLKIWDRAVEKWQTLRNRWGDGRPVIATVVGRLDTRNEQLGVPERIPALPDTKLVPWGYGHLGVFPARIVLLDIRDLEVSTNRGR